MTNYIDERGDRVSTASSRKTTYATPTEARQGFRGQRVLIILVCGLLLAVMAWAGAELFGENIDNDAATQIHEVTPIAPADSGRDAPQPEDTQQPVPTDQDPTPQTGSSG